MKDLNLLIWLTQLGFSVVFPLAGFLFLARWLRETYGWGPWVIWAGLLLGGITAFEGLRSSLKAMSRMGISKKETEEDPPVSFNDHD